MDSETVERWLVLCKEMTAEQDPNKLAEMRKEIEQILESEEKRLEPGVS